MNEFTIDQLPIWMWIVLITVLLGQGTWLFHDARKKDRNRWFWGIWGLVQFPTPLFVYWLVGWITKRNLARNMGGGR